MKEKNRYGQYFTEGVVAEYMVSLISHHNGCQVLEPSCGKGVFLEKLAEKGFHNAIGYEIDNNLSREFKNVRYQSFLSVPTDEKYDVAIGNPPYIRWKNLETELKKELVSDPLWNKYFNSLCDYLFIFILKCIEHLEENGELIFICSDYWMNSTNSITLRNYMVANGYFKEIYHFKEAPLFEKVNASFVIFKYIKAKKHSDHPIVLYTYTEKGKPTIDSLESKTCFKSEDIPQFRQDQRWILATKKLQEELQWFESICIKSENLFEKELCRIGDYCDIGNGMVSGLDAAFKIPHETALIMNTKENEKKIEVLKAKNLEQYHYTDKESYIFIQDDITEQIFAKSYPHFETLLSPYKSELKKRYSYGRNLPYWEFAFPRSKALFERPEAKIFIPCKERISHKNYFRFCYAPAGVYPLQDVTAIVKNKECKESIEYLLAYLNSKYVYDWLRYNGIVKGEIVEFSETPIASIPYRKINWNNDYEIRIHKQITETVQKIVQQKKDFLKDRINELLDLLLYDDKNQLHEIA